ncbi:methyltransferase domain-containing protein [Pseudoalteromonas aurantia]|uniref:methyltransferase domain-containing protein n=1 Tax=Pseudoalteromonas aurantia TaxID=43654 RepID=UPI00384F1D3A
MHELPLTCKVVVLAFNMLHTVDNPLKVIKRIHELLKHDGLFISSTPCLADKRSLLVSLQMYLVTILSKIGVIPIAIRRYKSAHIDELITTESFQLVESEQIYKGASSYFIVVKKQ